MAEPRLLQDSPKIQERAHSLVALDSDDYRVNREQSAAAARTKVTAFGSEILDEILRADKDRGAQALQSRMARLSAKDEVVYQEVLAFFQETLRSRNVSQNDYIQQITRGYPGAPNAREDLLRAVKQESIPTDVMLMLVEVHRYYFLQERQRFEAELPELKQEYVSNLAVLANDPKHALPTDLFDPAFVEHRMGEVAILTADPLALMSQDNRIIIGEYSHTNNYGALLYDRAWHGSRTDKGYRHTLWHELNHVIAGRSVRNLGGKMFAMRTGLSIYDEHERRQRYDWLDEAVTETLTVDMTDPKSRHWNVGSYVDGRYIYKRLLQQIPEELFLRAYAENGDPRQPNNGIVHRPKLIDAVTQVYGEDFLRRLDDIIANVGLRAAGQHFDTIGRWNGA